MLRTLRIPFPRDDLGRLARGALEVLRTWQARAEQRRHLAELDDRMLADIGVGWAEAGHEAAKPFWRA